MEEGDDLGGCDPFPLCVPDNQLRTPQGLPHENNQRNGVKHVLFGRHKFQCQTSEALPCTPSVISMFSNLENNKFLSFSVFPAPG